MTNPEIPTGTFTYMALCHSTTVQILTDEHSCVVSTDARWQVGTTVLMNSTDDDDLNHQVTLNVNLNQNQKLNSKYLLTLYVHLETATGNKVGHN